MLDLLALVLDLPSVDREIRLLDLFRRASEEHKYKCFLLCSREQATSQRLHFAVSHEGFGKGMNTFFHDSSNSLSAFGHLSAYPESVLHSPQQQCLVPTMQLPFRTLSHFLTKFSVVLFQFYSSRSYISFKLVAMFV